MGNNYYLDLLYKKAMQLKEELKEIENSNYSDEYKKYLISGYIITLDSILEIGINDLHSSKLDEIASLIYYTRQKAVHYGFFNGMHNIENTANTIIELIEKNYADEKKFYSSLLDADSIDTNCKNVVIKNSQNISQLPAFYRLKSKDGLVEVCIPTKKVFSLTKQNKAAITSYVIDLSAKCSVYSLKDGKRNSYKEISGDELKDFLKDNFFIVEENYNKHNKAIKEIITKFVKDPVNSSQIMEYASNEQFCKNTIDIIRDFILEGTMFEAYAEHYHLIKDKYSLSRMQKADYSKLQHSFKKNILQYITQRDAFFIEVTTKRAKQYSEFMNDPDVSLQTLSTILIQLFETGPKHFSNQFISSSPEFKKCCTNLLRYRQIFSHYILSGKEYKEGLERFKNEFNNLIKLLETVNLNDVKIPVFEDYETYSLLERDKSDFYNHKHEQFLKIDGNNYIGKKIHYSSRNAKSDKLIAIIPYGSNASNTIYYSKDHNDYLNPVWEIDEGTGKRHNILVSKKALGDAKEVKIDFNLANLFKAYHMLKKVKSSGDIQIHFPASEENEYYAHYDSLENVIMRFFIQGYLPIELLRKTKLITNDVNKDAVYLVDEENNLIASIANSKKYAPPIGSNKDSKRFFSRIDDITHNFSKRRHSK